MRLKSAPSEPETLAGTGTHDATARKLGTQTLYALAGNVFTLAVGFPLQIYVSRALGAEGLGIYGLIDGGVAIVAGLLAFGVAQTLVRFVPEHLERAEYASIRRLIRLGAAILLVNGTLGYLVCLALIGVIARLWPEISQHRDAIITMGLLIPLTLMLFFLQQGLRGFQEIRYMVFGSSVVQLLVKVAATVILFSIGWRLQGYVLATVISTFCAVLWMGLRLRHEVVRLPLTPNDSSGPTPLAWRRYAAVCYASSLLITATGNIDRFLLGIFVTTGAVGVLVAVRQLQQLPAVFNQMLLMVGAPMFSAAHSRNDAAETRHLYGLITDWVVRASLPLILFLALFGHALLSLYGGEFAANGTPALRILIAAQLFNLASGPNWNVLVMCGLERFALRLDTTSMILTGVLMLVLVPKFGLLGAAIASAVATVFVNGAGLAQIRRRLGIGWWDKRYLRWLAPASSASVLGIGILFSGIALGAIALIGALIAMYALFALVSVVQGLHEDDKNLLRFIHNRLFNMAMENK